MPFRGQSQRLGSSGAARIHRLWGQAEIILLSGTQKAALPHGSCHCLFIYPFKIIEHLPCAGLALALKLLQCMNESGSLPLRSAV